MSCRILCFFIMLLSFMSPSAYAVESTGKSFVLWSGTDSVGSCVTANCHAVLGRAKYVHAPVLDGDCRVCHDTTDQPHPGKGSMRLFEKEPELCFQCHESPAAGMNYPHSAVEEGCTGCHSPHQGALPKFVMQEGGKLCLMCHEDVKDAAFVHGPVKGDNCGICHGVHGGEYEAMLNLPGNGGCLSCHSGIKKIMDDAVSQHDPVANGACWDCHAPHSSDYKPFLKAYYPLKLYAPYVEKETYALCFKCHNETAFVYERTSELTEFRNHNNNLHFFHVNRNSKGRACKSCHGVHGAAQGKLLVDIVTGFGQWGIPLKWVSDGEKATCYVGCHRPKTYDRTQWISNL